MSKFIIACPVCHNYAEASTGFFASKHIRCACGNVINVKTDRMTTKVCPSCGNNVVYDQAEGTDAKACMGLLKLADKYTPERLENACRRAFEYTPQPSYKNIQTILTTGQDKIQAEPEPPSSSQYGFTRGAEYYDRRKTEC